jgi:hypothetical protein
MEVIPLDYPHECFINIFNRKFPPDPDSSLTLAEQKQNTGHERLDFF